MEKDIYFESIKEEILNNEITRKVKDYSKNRSDLKTYASIGKTLEEAGKHYGEGIIKKYAEKLTKEFGKGYTSTRLKYYRKFYQVVLKSPTLSDELTFSHYCEIIWLEDNPRKYYYQIAVRERLSVRELRKRIKNKEFERLDDETKLKLMNNNETNEITDYIKNPIIINNKSRYEEISEKVLQKMILEDIPLFLKELGTGFTFIENEYKIKIGNRYNYMDLLLFNYIYNCFIVVELKVGELKKEHIGQIQIYMNYIDKNLKKDIHDKTIGIILVRKNNKYIMEYSSDKRIKAREYIVL